MIIHRISMKKARIFPARLFACLALSLIAFSTKAAGVEAATGAGASPTNQAAAEAPVPKSVFDTSTPYKDPFFPNSTRKRVQAVVTNTVVNLSDPSQYALKGLSGVEGQEVAIINNRNLAAGERGEITLPGGSTIWITVLKISQHSATILPDGQREPITVSLPKEDW
jgi:hypothetical protein